MKNIEDFYLKIFRFLEIQFSIYLNRCVFVMELEKTFILMQILTKSVGK